MSDMVEYGQKILGERGNYDWAVRCDVALPDGFVGITQFDENDKVKERVLLSPRQFAAIGAFVVKHLKPQKRKAAARVRP